MVASKKPNDAPMMGANFNAPHECSPNIVNATATMAPKAETRKENGIAQHLLYCTTPH
jgi:hypothetical protein